MTEPNDPFGPVVEAAVATHEMFVSFCDAGFTEEQALQIVIAMLVNNTPGGES